MNHNKYLFLPIALISIYSYSQVGINEETPNATLDVAASPADMTKVDGVIAPRLTGDELAAKDVLYEAPQTGAIVYATAAVSTTTTKTTNVTAAGYYYFDGTVWIALGGVTSGNTEPWYNQATGTEASLNTQDIYQMGSVAIQKTDNIDGVALDVQGAVRGGTNTSSEVGTNSAAFGTDNIAAGSNSFVAGQYNTLWGTGSSVFGADNIVGTTSNEGNWSLIAGLRNKTNSGRAFIFGMDNTISDNAYGLSDNYIMGTNNLLSGRNTYAIGNFLAATSVEQITIGRYNAIRTTGNPILSAPALTDPVLQIGIGRNSASYKNAITVLHNGKTGIGIIGTEAAAKPTEMLDIGSGNVRIRDINTSVGNTVTDRMVVADSDGVLKTVDASVVSGSSATAIAMKTTASGYFPSGTSNTITFDTTPVLNGATYSAGTFTVTEAGYYQITLNVGFQISEDYYGYADLMFYKNGTMNANKRIEWAWEAIDSYDTDYTIVKYLAANDTFHFKGLFSFKNYRFTSAGISLIKIAD